MYVAFEGGILHSQYCVENKRLNAYFPKHKVGIEIDEYDHKGRNPNYEQSRQFMIEGQEITVIRTNPDAADFDMNRLINQLYMHVIESTKKQNEKSLIGKISKRLLELEFKSNHTIKSKCLKPIKTGK